MAGTEGRCRDRLRVDGIRLVEVAVLKPRPAYLDSPKISGFMKYLSAANVALFQLTGGALGGKFRTPGNLRGFPVCLLTTRGRKTGKPRTKPLIYLADGARIVLVASRNGMPRNPAWYLNLQAEPRVLIQTGRHRRRMRARTADDKERAELWPRMVELYPDYENYQSWTDRKIPVVICEPS
jgi:F420H(2)-dependent quinone reductase